MRRLFTGALALSTLGLTLSGAFAAGATDRVAPDPFDGDPAWIAYQTFRDDHEGVWLVHPDGSGDHELDLGLPVTAQLPDWSPDGTRLAVTTRGGETEPLYEHVLATGVTTQLFDCTYPCVGDDEPAYSPDGASVAFIRYLGPFDENGPSDCSLWIGDRVTGQVRRVTDNEGCDREYFPRWSPDGSRLTYHRELPQADGSVRTAVYVVNADGTGETRLTDPAMVAGSPDWSPDGQWIVFATYPLNVFQSGGDSQLYRMHPDGTGLAQMTAFRGVRATQPRYKPDGQWILFTAVRPQHRSIWAMPADGGAPVVIARAERIYTHPTWQPGAE
ncbi:MAG: TolB family protein [Nocardioides sp.]